jgi:hypothetical protein
MGGQWLPLDQPVAPRLNLRVDLLIQFADRARTDPRAPQGLAKAC